MQQDTYVIGAGDVLQISVWDNPQVSNTVPVRPDGRISLALLDDVQASGLTPLELKEVIGQQLTEFIGNAKLWRNRRKSHTVARLLERASTWRRC